MVVRELAVLWVPAGPEARRWQRIDVDYCEAVGYDIAAVILADPTGERWGEVQGMACRREFDVLVAARRDQLPAHRKPRIEVVDEIVVPYRRRRGRPRIIR